MKTVYITRRERFNAAHKLWNPDWDEQKNLDVFGKCANPNWHGHNYELLVTVKGTPKPDTGYCLDLKDLSTMLKEKVVNVFDHKNINLDVECMQGQIASTENMIITMWDLIAEPVEQMGCKLHKLELRETENNKAEYYGEE